MRKHTKYSIILLLFVVSLIVSVILSFSPISAICAPQQGCNIIHDSNYNLLFGIENSYYGVLIFAILIILTVSQLKKPGKHKEFVIHLATLIGSLIALYFLYLQVFVLNTYCKYCLVVDFSIIITLIVAIFIEDVS